MAEALTHVTLNTGDSRRSPRSEVRDHIIAELKPIIAAGQGEIGGLHINIESSTVFTLGWRPGRTAVRCWLSSAQHPESWGAVEAQGEEPPLPWLAVVLLPDALE